VAERHEQVGRAERGVQPRSRRASFLINGQARSSLLMKQTSPKVCTITSEWLRMSKRADTGNGISVAGSAKTALM
jgi:hypothetical protein